MILWTSQMSNWRVVKAKGIPVFDVTVKSGFKQFAPSWLLLNDYKSGKITEEQYTERYLVEMRVSFVKNKKIWEELTDYEEVCIICYCPSGNFCHRLILVNLLEKVCKSLGKDFTYKGEINKQN